MNNNGYRIIMLKTCFDRMKDTTYIFGHNKLTNHFNASKLRTVPLVVIADKTYFIDFSYIAPESR